MILPLIFTQTVNWVLLTTEPTHLCVSNLQKTKMSVSLLWSVYHTPEFYSCFGFSENISIDRSKPNARGRCLTHHAKLKQNWNYVSSGSDLGYPYLLGTGERRNKTQVVSSMLVNPAVGETRLSFSEQKVYDAVMNQAALIKRKSNTNAGEDAKPEIILPGTLNVLTEAYDRCSEVCAEYAKTFYLGTMLMTPERRKAIWAIYVWCRRTDELVDGPNASHITPTALNRWELRLEQLFNGQPFDMLDAALADTVAKFPVDIQPFKDMIEGMRMDLKKSRYKNFDELYLYCYYVAGTVGLMSVPVMGICSESHVPTENIYNAALDLGIANQLTNILRDVGEDARRGRVYLPQDELAQAGISEDDIFAGKVTEKWRSFMKNQIKRARMFFDEAEKGVTQLSADSRWPVWASLLLYRQILDEIEANDYNNFTKRAYVNKPKKMITLPMAYVKSSFLPSTKQTTSTSIG